MRDIVRARLRKSQNLKLDDRDVAALKASGEMPARVKVKAERIVKNLKKKKVTQEVGETEKSAVNKNKMTTG